MTQRDRPGAGITGEPEDGKPVPEAEHFDTCPECGQVFDMRQLDQVLHHDTPGHRPIPADA